MTNNINIVANAYVSVTLQPLADGKYRIEEFAKLRTLDPEVARLYHSQSECVVIDAQLGLRVAPTFMTFMKVGKIVGEEIIRQLEAAGEKLIEIEKKVAECAANVPVTIYVGGSEAPASSLEGMEIGSMVRLRRDVNGLGEAGSEHKVCWVPNGGCAVKMKTIEDSLYRTSGELFFRINDDAELFELVVESLKTVLDCQHADGSEYSWYVEENDPTEYSVGDFVEVEHLGGYENECLLVVKIRQAPESNLPACRVVGKVCRKIKGRLADGSQHVWCIDDRDKTEYQPGDLVKTKPVCYFFGNVEFVEVVGCFYHNRDKECLLVRGDVIFDEKKSKRRRQQSEKRQRC